MRFIVFTVVVVVFIILVTIFILVATVLLTSFLSLAVFLPVLITITATPVLLLVLLHEVLVAQPEQRLHLEHVAGARVRASVDECAGLARDRLVLDGLEGRDDGIRRVLKA